MGNGTLKFIIDDDDKNKGESYTNIPLDKPLIPVVILYDSNDKVKIIEYENLIFKKRKKFNKE